MASALPLPAGISQRCWVVQIPHLQPGASPSLCTGTTDSPQVSEVRALSQLWEGWVSPPALQTRSTLLSLTPAWLLNTSQLCAKGCQSHTCIELLTHTLIAFEITLSAPGVSLCHQLPLHGHWEGPAQTLSASSAHTYSECTSGAQAPILPLLPQEPEPRASHTERRKHLLSLLCHLHNCCPTPRRGEVSDKMAHEPPSAKIQCLTAWTGQSHHTSHRARKQTLRDVSVLAARTRINPYRIQLFAGCPEGQTNQHIPGAH